VSGYYSGPVEWALWAMLGAIAVVGSVVVYRALRAYRARRSTPLLFLGAGLLMISLGMPALWMGAYWLTDNILWCSLLGSIGILAGFVLVLLSIETRKS
jgi:NAD/NADP transhydrogenase beta subunit